MARSISPSLWKTTQQLQEQSRILREGLKKHPAESKKAVSSKTSKSLSHRAQSSARRRPTKS
jgi:hypothetical protein